MWDIVGKELNRPIYDLLGGKINEQLRTYTYIYPDSHDQDDVYSNAKLAAEKAVKYKKDGFTALLAVVAPNLMSKPATCMFNKVTIKGAKQAVQMFGPAQAAVSMAVADSVKDGTIPAAEANDIFICVGVFIHWDANDDTRIYDYNYEATMMAIKGAVSGKPTADEVVAAAADSAHPYSPK